MSIDNIIRMALLGAYTLYLIIYSILTALWHKREQKGRKGKRYIQDNLLADLLESGVEIPKEQMIKYLRGEEYKPQPKTIPSERVEDKPAEEIPVGTPPSVIVGENK